ncbi:hypothetical protein [Rhizobium lentis]|uniref:Uncharacterized protein n=1 Tax=Rhizobium lentis TaxID=1138194 RepID=A0ABS7IIN6_9HYPH|nr:hypothetical protein [Rhizobium lentis]MBX5045794.1 hypothetical protein [Rhizobium lentis]MBX5057806.1 hypothetical protein [Rhizobium lentis]MBX5089264.1 hypothetical protein [Rhizobium lentis]
MIARKKAHFEAISAGIQPEGRDNPFGFRADRLCQILVTPTARITDPNGTILSVYKLESDLRQAMTIPNALIFHGDKQVVMLVSASTTAALERNLDICRKQRPQCRSPSEQVKSVKEAGFIPTRAALPRRQPRRSCGATGQDFCDIRKWDRNCY